MNTDKNVQTIKGLYENFTKGNIPALLDGLSDNIIWVDAGAPAIPYAGTFKGKNEVAQFFSKMNEHCEVLKFDINNIVGFEDKVVSTGVFDIKSRKTGKSAETEWAMLWNFTDGKPSHFRSYLDTAKFAKAFN